MKRLRYENGGLDEIDVRISHALAEDARIPVAELARSIGLSSPSIKERINRLEEAGVVQGYTIRIDVTALGLPIAAWIRIRPLPGELSRVADILHGIPEIVECDRVTGEDCFFARAHVESIAALEKLVDKVIPIAMTNTSVIQSSPVPIRLPQILTRAA